MIARSTSPSGWNLRWRPAAAALVACLGLAACNSVGADSADPVANVSGASIEMTFAKQKDWNPSQPLVVKANGGKLTNVVIKDQRGHKLAGRYLKHRTQWTSTDSPLSFDTHYTVLTRAEDAAGLGVRKTTTVSTVKPDTTAYTSITPYGGSVVGVGMPIILTFDQPVTRKAAVERSLSVETKPATVGSWYWVNDQMVRWRPRHYWQPGTDVTVRSELAGVNFGNGVWGDDDDMARFNVGDAMISTVDIANHMMTVRRNGELLRKIPVTTGKPGWDTRIGTKVIMSKQLHVVMDAATIDVDKSDPEYYRLDVAYAMRLTWSGEYLHAAPWSVADQGIDNVSHGCTGMSTENAIWLYNLSNIGDVVNYVGGTRPMEPWNGYTDWNMSWKDWKTGSALS